MNYAAYIANVQDRLLSQGFTELALPADLAGRIALVLERQEKWGRLIIALAGKLNLAAPEEREGVVAAAGAWLRNDPAGGQLILVFPFDRRVTEEESAAITALRQEDPNQRWAVIPWTADLEVELLDRHAGFPPVDLKVAQALTEVPRGAVESLVRRSTGPRVGWPRLGLSLDQVPVTRVILASTFAYYLLAVLMAGGDALSGIGWVLTGPDRAVMGFWGANDTMRTLYEGEQWRLVTHMFLHFGLLHLGFNMMALWSVGRQVEIIYGSGRTAFIYLASGIIGGIASAAFRPGFAFSAGASGAVLGLFGAMIYFGLTFRDRPANWHGLWGPVAINLLYGFFLGFVDNYAHIGGFLGGVLTGFIAGVPGFRQPWRLGAMALFGALLALVVMGRIPLPHFGSAP